MTDDEAPPDQGPATPTRAWWRVLRSAFTIEVGWQARVTVIAGLFIVAMQDSLAAGLLFAAFWAVTLQLVLSNTWLTGWLKGEASNREIVESQGALIEGQHELIEAYRENRGPAVNMADLLDLCDEHGVPPEKLAAVVWGDADG